MYNLNIKEVYKNAYRSLDADEIREINLDGDIISQINQLIIELSNDGLMEINVNMKNLLSTKIFELLRYYESLDFLARLHCGYNKKLVLYISWDIEKIIYNINNKEKIKNLENIMKTVKGH